jgi:hypothetical protein
VTIAKLTSRASLAGGTSVTYMTTQLRSDEGSGKHNNKSDPYMTFTAGIAEGIKCNPAGNQHERTAKISIDMCAQERKAPTCMHS